MNIFSWIFLFYQIKKENELSANYPPQSHELPTDFRDFLDLYAGMENEESYEKTLILWLDMYAPVFQES